MLILITFEYLSLRVNRTKQDKWTMGLNNVIIKYITCQGSLLNSRLNIRTHTSFSATNRSLGNWAVSHFILHEWSMYVPFTTLPLRCDVWRIPAETFLEPPSQIGKLPTFFSILTFTATSWWTWVFCNFVSYYDFTSWSTYQSKNIFTLLAAMNIKVMKQFNNRVHIFKR